MFYSATDFLALDFDGVIADSIGECLVVGYNAFTNFSGNNQKILLLEELNRNQIIESKRLRNFIRSAEDYVYIFLALNKKASIKDQQDFDNFIEKYKDLKTPFFSFFYREREYLINQQKELWIKLNPLYLGMKTFLTKYTNKKNLFIITTKKISFANQILLANGIQLEKSNMLNADEKINKRDIISNLIKKSNILPTSFHFIDDQIDTLVKVADTGIHCYLAEWGYNNAEQINRAKSENISIIKLKIFLANFRTKPNKQTF